MGSRLLSFTKRSIGLVVYLAMAFLLPILVPLLNVHSNVPSSWGALAYPFALIPFLMGFAQPLFETSARKLLGACAAMITVIGAVAILNSLRTGLYLHENVFFYGVLLVGFLVFSRFGVMTSERLQVQDVAPV